MSNSLVIGLDGRAFAGAQAGTGRYAREFCKVLDAELPQAQFIVYSKCTVNLPVQSARWRLHTESNPFWRKLPDALWSVLRVGQLLEQDGVQIFWGQANYLPHRVPKNCCSILTVHDLVGDLYPQTMTWRHRLLHRLFFKSGVQEASYVLASSQGTSDRLARHYGRLADLVLSPQAGALFVPPRPEQVDQVKLTYQLPEQFLLSVATLEPRKNLQSLLLACENLLLAGKDPGALVLVGQRGWLLGDLAKTVQAVRAKGFQVIALGYVPDEQLPVLYAASRLVVLPSIYEGFGMPVLEALNCGARVLTTDTPETREAGGDRAIYCGPTVHEIAQALALELAEPASSQRHGGNHAQMNSWAQEGQKLLKLIRSITGQRS